MKKFSIIKDMKKKDIKFFKVYSAQPEYKQSKIISVEVEVRSGQYQFSIIGMTDKAVMESKDRVSSALSVNGLPDPKHSNEKTTVLLAPADLKKNGSLFDIPIAISYLCACRLITSVHDKQLFIGELGLDGSVRSVKGVLSIMDVAEKNNFTEIFVPVQNCHESCFSEDIIVYPVSHLNDIINHLNDIKKITPYSKERWENKNSNAIINPFCDIRGQELAKRALVIAACGGHHIGLYGPPGTGKTMLARAYRNLLPGLSKQDSKEITELYSVSGNGDDIIYMPPFRSPHHTSSSVSIVGGGAYPKPGEISLAHHGVLFMDEFPEFEKRVLESLREPLEDGVISISRAKEKITYPAKCNLVIAMNPCPCGYYGSTHKSCSCSFSDIQKYHKKLSGPLMDRIDMWVNVEHVPLSVFHDEAEESVHEDLVKKVASIKRISQKRNLNKIGVSIDNRDIASKFIPVIGITKEAQAILEKSAEKLSLSPRGYHRAIKLARTIADVEGCENIECDHVLEALQYRPSFK